MQRLRASACNFCKTYVVYGPTSGVKMRTLQVQTELYECNKYNAVPAFRYKNFSVYYMNYGYCTMNIPTSYTFMQLDFKWVIVPRYCTRYILAIHGLEVGNHGIGELLSRGLCNIGLLTPRICHADCREKPTHTYFSIHICTVYILSVSRKVHLLCTEYFIEVCTWLFCFPAIYVFFSVSRGVHISTEYVVRV